MTVKLLLPHPPYLAGDLFSADPNTEAGLVALGIATATTTGGVAPSFPQQAATGAAGWLALNGDYRLTATDDGKCFACLGPLTVTVPLGLYPRPTVCVMPPASGNLSIAGMLNGSSQTVMRSRANNSAGVCIAAYQDADNYGVGGN
jgi:hypothetical protein